MNQLSPWGGHGVTELMRALSLRLCKKTARDLNFLCIRV